MVEEMLNIFNNITCAWEFYEKYHDTNQQTDSNSTLVIQHTDEDEHAANLMAIYVLCSVLLGTINSLSYAL